MRDLLSVPAMRPPGSPRRGVPGRLHREAAGERPPRARPQRRGSPGPIPNPAVKPAFAESTAARGCGRAGRRARGGRFSIGAERGPRGDVAPAALFVCWAALLGGMPRSTPRAAELAGRLHRRAAGEAGLARGFVSRVLSRLESSFRSACFRGTFSSAVLLRIVSRFRWSFPFLGLLAIVLVGLIRHTNCLAS